MLKAIEFALKFRDKRGWKKFHNPKDLALSIAIESSELLEIFQWVSEDESYKVACERINDVRDEVADILIYLIYLCDVLNIDMEEVVIEKVKKNEEKYPI